MQTEGIEQVFVLPFDSDFRSLARRSSRAEVLVEGVGAAGVLVGQNFRFGAKQARRRSAVDAAWKGFGFCVEVVPSVYVRGGWHPAPKFGIFYRRAPYRLPAGCWSGRIGSRDKSFRARIGSKKTVPTLNLDTAAEVIPADGVYITRTVDLDNSREWQSISNIGVRPTFDGRSERSRRFC